MTYKRGYKMMDKECLHLNEDGSDGIEYNDTYEMRSWDMYCKVCGKEGSRKELESDRRKHLIGKMAFVGDTWYQIMDISKENGEEKYLLCGAKPTWTPKSEIKDIEDLETLQQANKPLTFGDVIRFVEKMKSIGHDDVEDWILKHGGSNLLNPIEFLGTGEVNVHADFKEYRQSDNT